jgi:hypothetical protein
VSSLIVSEIRGWRKFVRPPAWFTAAGKPAFLYATHARDGDMRATKQQRTQLSAIYRLTPYK